MLEKKEKKLRKLRKFIPQTEPKSSYMLKNGDFFRVLNISKSKYLFFNFFIFNSTKIFPNF